MTTTDEVKKKIPHFKRKILALGHTQVAECLPGEHKTLSSNASTPQINT
jgi:hypothetical protein